MAKTIYYRRRKGTLPMLEELARDVTGWAAHAVEFFELLGWTQWVRNHHRRHALQCPDIRRVEGIDRLNGPFDAISHTVDVRAIARDESWYNIKNIGFFPWRLRSYAAEATDARRLGGPGDFRCFFSPLGNSAPLFTRLRREGDEAGLATEPHVPGPIRPARFFEDVLAYQANLAAPDHSAFYGPFDRVEGVSIFIVVDGVEVPPGRIRCRDLEKTGH